MTMPTPTVGLAALIASLLIPLAQVVAPVVQEAWTTDMRLEVEKAIADERLALERAISSEKQREQVADILLNRYIDQDAEDQRKALAIIVGLFPRFASELEEALARYAANETVKDAAERVVARAAEVPLAAVDLARAAERAGFDALLNNDIPAARAQFNKAYTAYPQFHNVDEIRRKLDTVRHEDPAAIARVKSSIVNENAWRMPEEVRQNLLQQTQQP